MNTKRYRQGIPAIALLVLALAGCASTSAWLDGLKCTYGPWTTCTDGKTTRVVTSAHPELCTLSLSKPCMSPPPAACAYTYSEWAACADNKQLRTVAAATPAGCVGTPSLERACPTEPPPAEGYVIAKGLRVEKKMSIPGALQFTLTGKEASVEDGSAKDNMHLAWSYSSDWGGGNVTTGGTGYVCGLRDYALKCYNVDGTFASQARYSVKWDPAKSYVVRLEIAKDKTRVLVDGVEVAAVAVTAPDETTTGYGDPPSQRPGAYGATLTGITWEGAK